MKGLQELIRSLRVAAVTDPFDAAGLDAAAKEEWGYTAGLQIWIFGLPLMRTEQLRRLMTSLDGPLETLPYAPVNQLGHMRMIPDSDTDLPFTPNVDTLYSGSVLEFGGDGEATETDGDAATGIGRGTAMIFRAPAMPDRYWSLQVADAYYSNLTYLGTRATGTDAGVWLFVGPHWEGEVPDGVRLYRCPTDTVTIALRIRIEGPDDTAATVTAQHGFRLSTLDSFLAGDEKPAKPGRPPRMPLDTHDLAFFTTLCRLLRFNPPYARDDSVVHLMRVLGLTPGADIDPDTIDPAIRRGLVRAADEGPRIIAWKVKHRGRKSATMWNVDLTGGSYGTDYLARAEGAIQGMFVHDPEEATYFHTYHDGNGDPLDGGRNYTLRFSPDQLAPTKWFGFWSITGYGTDFTLIPNEYGRYSVQSWDPGLRFDEDGGITIHVGPDVPRAVPASASSDKVAPGEVPMSNWVATEPGRPFRLNYRVYLSQDSLRDPARVDSFLPPVTPLP